MEDNSVNQPRHRDQDLNLASQSSLDKMRANQDSIEEYARFRENMLRHLEATSKGRRSSSPRSASPTSMLAMLQQAAASTSSKLEQAAHQHDDNDNHPVFTLSGGYIAGLGGWDRRKKNNEAAKRSRDTRRAKEDEVAVRAAFLEQENLQLKFEAARLKSETARLRAILINDTNNAAAAAAVAAAAASTSGLIEAPGVGVSHPGLPFNFKPQ